MTNKGQSIIEYALITMLVILGIVFMGPYVLRSVNAHFKLWDEGVQDSFEENLKQAPLNSVPPINATCECTPVRQNCGSSHAGSFCAAHQREISFNCNPQGCNGADPNRQSYCEDDPTCCTQWVNEGCGTIPLDQPPTSFNCNYGYQIQAKNCGPNPSMQCVPDASCPMPQCVGLVTEPQSIRYCATGSSSAPTSGLTDNTAISYVGNEFADCSTPYLCQVYCNPPYVLNNAGNACETCVPSLPSRLKEGPPSNITCSNPNAGTQNPPSGENYFFFNFYCNGNLNQQVTKTGVIVPGSQTYHLRLVSGRGKTDNHCVQESHNGVNQYICDQAIVENSSEVLHIKVGDQNTNGQAAYSWSILDKNYQEVFAWNGNLDYTMGVAFAQPCSVPPTQSNTCPAYKVTSRDWNPWTKQRAIWVAPQGGPRNFQGYTGVLTREFTAPAGTYKVRMRVDDRGSVDIDGDTVCSANPDTFGDKTCSNVQIQATQSNIHTVTLRVKNDKNGSNWASNPTGMAVTITNKATNQVVLDSGVLNDLDKWTTALSCPSNRQWNCTTHRCE